MMFQSSLLWHWGKRLSKVYFLHRKWNLLEDVSCVLYYFKDIYNNIN